MWIADDYGSVMYLPAMKLDGDGPIQELFTGHVIDFRRIVSISRPYHVDHMGHGGIFVEFDITFLPEASRPFEEAMSQKSLGSMHFSWSLSTTWVHTEEESRRLSYVREYPKIPQEIDMYGKPVLDWHGFDVDGALKSLNEKVDVIIAFWRKVTEAVPARTQGRKVAWKD